MARLRQQAPVRRPSSKEAQDPVNIQNIWEFNELKYKGRQIFLILMKKGSETSVLFLRLPCHPGFKNKNKYQPLHSYCPYTTYSVDSILYVCISLCVAISSSAHNSWHCNAELSFEHSLTFQSLLLILLMPLIL